VSSGSNPPARVGERGRKSLGQFSYRVKKNGGVKTPKGEGRGGKTLFLGKGGMA